MPDWLLLPLLLVSIAAGVFALLRANRVDAAMRRALAALPADTRGTAAGASLSDAASASVTLPDAQGPLTRVAVVRFDAFADISGKLSSAAAVLDDHGNGLVITTMNGRENTRNYLKQVRRGVGVVALSPEENDAVARAMGNRKAVS